jgi:hypothetical protein
VITEASDPETPGLITTQADFQSLTSESGCLE